MSFSVPNDWRAGRIWVCTVISLIAPEKDNTEQTTLFNRLAVTATLTWRTRAPTPALTEAAMAGSCVTPSLARYVDSVYTVWMQTVGRSHLPVVIGCPSRHRC